MNMKKKIVAFVMSLVLCTLLVSPVYAADSSEATMNQIVNDLIQFADAVNNASSAVNAYPSVSITSDACNVVKLAADQYIVDAINLCGDNPELQATKASFMDVYNSVPSTVDAHTFAYSCLLTSIYEMNALSAASDVIAAHGYNI